MTGSPSLSINAGYLETSSHNNHLQEKLHKSLALRADPNNKFLPADKDILLVDADLS